MHVWTNPIWWNHRGKQDRNSNSKNKTLKRQDSFFPPCLFKRLELFPNNTSGSGRAQNTRCSTKTTKPPTSCQNLRPASLSLPVSVSMSLAHQNVVMGHFIVLFCPWGWRGEERREGVFWRQSQLCALWFFCCFWKFANTTTTTGSLSLQFLSQSLTTEFFLICPPLSPSVSLPFFL